MQQPANYSFWSPKYWQAIHVIAMLYVKNNESAPEAARCFYYSLSRLLPTEEAKWTVQQFISDYPIDNYLSSGERLFYWTWLMHNTVRRKQGKQDFPLRSASALYDESALTKSDWGGPVWFILHYTAKTMPEQIPQGMSTSFKALIVCLQYLLPCPKCRKHLALNLVQLHIDDYIWAKDSLFLWTVLLHNQVNKDLNKPFIPVDQAWNLYTAPKAIPQR